MPSPGKIRDSIFTPKNFFRTHLTETKSRRKIKYNIRPSKTIQQEALHGTRRSTGVCQSILPFA